MVKRTKAYFKYLKKQKDLSREPNASELMRNGIQRALDSAENKSENWSAKAYCLFLIFCRSTKTEFQAENFREYCLGKLDEPPSNRAFGGVMLKARHEGIIQKVGYKSVSNPKAHCTPAALWKSKLV